jgi:hypothetical protein
MDSGKLGRGAQAFFRRFPRQHGSFESLIHVGGRPRLVQGREVHQLEGKGKVMVTKQRIEGLFEGWGRGQEDSKRIPLQRLQMA